MSRKKVSTPKKPADIKIVLEFVYKLTDWYEGITYSELSDNVTMIEISKENPEVLSEEDKEKIKVFIAKNDILKFFKAKEAAEEEFERLEDNLEYAKSLNGIPLRKREWSH